MSSFPEMNAKIITQLSWIVLVWLVLPHRVQCDHKTMRRRLNNYEDTLEYIPLSQKAPLLLAFFEVDKNGSIVDKENPTGAYTRLLEIEKKNPKVAIGMVKNSTFMHKFGIDMARPFVQITYSAPVSYAVNRARFYKDFALAEFYPGELRAVFINKQLRKVRNTKTKTIIY